ncbi:MAG: anthrone oxygenase family protein [Pseudomonadales bacterium]
MIYFALLASTASGLLAGALVTEACVLVPYWKTMDPEQFRRLHSTLSPLLFRFYAPLTVAGTSLPLLVCASQWAVGGPAVWLWTVSATCATGLLAFYFGFFRQANIEFANGHSQETSLEQTGETLSTWATMHQMRTIVAVLGFVFAGLALAVA